MKSKNNFDNFLILLSIVLLNFNSFLFLFTFIIYIYLLNKSFKEITFEINIEHPEEYLFDFNNKDYEEYIKNVDMDK